MDGNTILAPNSAENVEGATTEKTNEAVKQNVEQVAEQSNASGKTYTEDEVNARVDELLGKKIARREAKIRKEYEKKYGDLESVLKAGTGKENVEEVTEDLKKFYEGRGIQIPQQPTYSDKDIAVLAKAEAADIIKAGLDDVIEEADRLLGIGVENMTPREKLVFAELVEYRKTTEQSRELSKLGVTEDVYNSKEFKEFASQFNQNTPITKVYEIYNKMQPKTEVRTMGSVKNSTQTDTGVKDFYTRDEALSFTKKDFDKNPDLYKAVQQSMYQW